MRTRGRKNHVPHYPASPTDHPVVVILGRPNVGKSTIFNRLAGRAVSIVMDQPGVTRDRLYAEGDIMGRQITLVDTGGWEYAPETDTEKGINQQCRAALSEAAVVLFVVDGRHPLTAGDYETADFLRKSGVPAVLVINKIDGQKQALAASDAWALGLTPTVMVSGLHGRGFNELEHEIFPFLPVTEAEISPSTDDSEEAAESASDTEYATRIAIIGRPNVGKSSLINRLLNEDRLLTQDMPGTTRDPVDIRLRFGDQDYVLVDTAGIRRKSKVHKDSPEHLAVTAAVGTMSRCRVVVLMVDAAEEAAEQDAKILGLAVDRGRAVVLALNKWDLLAGDARRQRSTQELLTDKLSFCPWAKTVSISAVTGKGIRNLFMAIDAAAAAFNRRVPTSRLNDLIEDIIAHHPPPLRKGRPVKLYFATQVSVRPPTFVIHCNYPEALHFSYQRYVENRIRTEFDFDGSPLRMIFRKRARRGDN